MISTNYKIVCWWIWLIGLFSIAIPWYFCHEHVFNFVFATLYSSSSFMGLAIYTKKVFESKEITPYQKNIKFSGIIGALILSVLFAIWAFSSPISSFSPASFFWILSFGTMIIGFVVGGLMHVAILKIMKEL